MFITIILSSFVVSIRRGGIFELVGGPLVTLSMSKFIFFALDSLKRANNPIDIVNWGPRSSFLSLVHNDEFIA